MATNRTVAAAATAAKLQAQQHFFPTLSATLAGREEEKRARGKSQSRHLPIILAARTDSYLVSAAAAPATATRFDFIK